MARYNQSNIKPGDLIYHSGFPTPIPCITILSSQVTLLDSRMAMFSDIDKVEKPQEGQEFYHRVLWREYTEDFTYRYTDGKWVLANLVKTEV